MFVWIQYFYDLLEESVNIMLLALQNGYLQVVAGLDFNGFTD